MIVTAAATPLAASQAVVRDRAIKLYGGTFAKRPLPDGEDGYSVDHPGSLFVLSPKGEVLTVARYGTSIEELTAILRAAVEGKPVPKAKKELLCTDCG